MASQELRVVGAWFPFNSSLFKRKLINHQPNRHYWNIVPLLRMLDPAFFGRCSQNGGFVFLLEGGFGFVSGVFLLFYGKTKLPGVVFSCLLPIDFRLGARVQGYRHTPFLLVTW